eukprot:scaffold63559_cov75-Phaeocystis_antarctica.AAC.2
MGARRASLASRMAMGRRGDRGTDAGPPLRPASYVCYYCRVCLDGQGNSDHCDDCPRVSCEPFKIVITFLDRCGCGCTVVRILYADRPPPPPPCSSCWCVVHALSFGRGEVSAMSAACLSRPLPPAPSPFAGAESRGVPRPAS